MFFIFLVPRRYKSAPIGSVYIYTMREKYRMRIDEVNMHVRKGGGTHLKFTILVHARIKSLKAHDAMGF